MYSDVIVSGLVTKITHSEEKKEHYLLIKSTRSMLNSKGESKSSAFVIIAEPEGYEEYTGKVEIGDQVLVFGRFRVNTKGGPYFDEKNNKFYFVVSPYQLHNFGKLSVVGGHDVFKVVVLGNLGKDPECRYMDDGKAVCNINVASSRAFKAEGSSASETTWWRFAFWGDQAENLNEFAHKGNRILVEGSIQYDLETGSPKIFTKKDGSLGSSFEVTGRIFRLTTPKSANIREAGEAPMEEEGTYEGSDQTVSENATDDFPF